MNATIVRFKQWSCTPKFARYSNDRVAIQLLDSYDHELVTTVTVNMPDVPLRPDEVIIKNYSENEGMQKAMELAGLISEPIRYVSSGFLSNIPVCKLLISLNQ